MFENSPPHPAQNGLAITRQLSVFTVLLPLSLSNNGPCAVCSYNKSQGFWVQAEAVPLSVHMLRCILHAYVRLCVHAKDTQLLHELLVGTHRICLCCAAPARRHARLLAHAFQLRGVHSVCYGCPLLELQYCKHYCACERTKSMAW